MSRLIRKVLGEKGHWIVFGESEDYSVADIADSESTLLMDVPRQLAGHIVEKHNATVDALAAYCSESVDGIGGLERREALEEARRLCVLRMTAWTVADDQRSQDFRDGIEKACSDVAQRLRGLEPT